MREAISWSVAAMAIGVSLVVSGCASEADLAREQAVSAVRASAEDVRERLESIGPGDSEQERLDAVRSLISGGVPFATELDATSITSVGVLLSRGESGGGLSYKRYTARMCLRYRVDLESGRTTVADAPCPDDADGSASADETVHVKSAG